MTPLPHSREAEEHVLACCLFLDDKGQSFTRAKASGITINSFLDPACRTIFGTLERMTKQGINLSYETLAPELNGTLEAVGGYAYLNQLTDISKYPTTANAGYFIQKLRDLEQKRTAIQNAAALIERLGNGEDLEDVRELASNLLPERLATGSIVPSPITAFTYPEEGDPNIILGSDDYLGRGGGLLFVSHAGAGKSSWAMDACMMWALGRTWMQIKAHTPRRILIIQAEDSDRYIGKIFASFAHVNKLTPDELETMGKNCVIVRLKGVSGQAFFSELKRLADLHQPDLVVINPIYLYAEGDITRSEFAQPFLLGLDAVNKAEKFAYILIHHTGKPAAKDKNGKRAEVEDWESAYMGFGSSYLANWPRASILLEPIAGRQGSYQIKLGKGGLNAGVTKLVPQGVGHREEPCTRIAIKHSKERMDVNGKSRPVYYWELDGEPEDAAPKGKGGRPSKYAIEQFLQFIPAKYEDALSAPQIHRKMNGASGIPASSFADLLFRASSDGKIMLLDITGKGPVYYRKTESTETHGNPTET